MKKSHKTGLHHWLADAALKSLAVFLLFGATYYAYSQVTFPVGPKPTTGLVGQYVGSLPARAGNAGGYNAVSSDCGITFADSHVCSPIEIINTYNNNPNSLNALTGQYWVNSGTTPLESATNDCQGWKSNSPSHFGNVWSFTSDKALLQTCNQSLPIACCK